MGNGVLVMCRFGAARPGRAEAVKFPRLAVDNPEIGIGRTSAAN